MKRLFSSLLVAGFLAVPAVASAEPQYVWVRYGSGAPYIYVTNEPRPYYVRPAYYVTTDGVVRYVTTDVRFDSDVAAACGTVTSSLYFAPVDTTLDATDRTALANLAFCMNRGPLSGSRIEVVAGYDGSAASLERSMARQSAVIEYLGLLGVSPSRLIVSRELAPGWQSDRVRFRLTGPTPVPWPYL